MVLNLGVKGSIEDDQFYDRLYKNPKIIEFHLTEGDLFGEKRMLLIDRIKECKELGITVFLHHPQTFQGEDLNIIHKNPTAKEFYKLSTMILIDLIEKYDANCICHLHYSGFEWSEVSLMKMYNEIKALNDMSSGRIFWENSIDGLFTFQNKTFFEDFVLPLDLNICFDISHAFISFKGDNNKLIRALDQTKDHTQYYHVVDSMGEAHDSLELGKGLIKWEEVLPYLEKRPYIYEIGLTDQSDCTQMIKSHEVLKSLKIEQDRLST